MAEPDPALEQRLADLLAAYDNDLASGVAPARTSSPGDAGLEDRFQGAASCLRLLDQLRPGRAAPAEWPDGEGAADERYHLQRLVATGGIGRVWLAYDSELEREVALKELRPERLADADLAARFLREARVTGQLQHPGIVPVYELAREEDGCPAFYTMRFVRGQTLTEAVRAYHAPATGSKRLGLIQLLGAFARVCKTIAYAHTQGVIHCDLKGQNVVLGDFGEVIVLDWGLAALQDEMTARREAASSDPSPARRLPGTPAYMAPEQARGEADRVGPRTDVFGLGAILYEILTGRPPFVGEDSASVLRHARQARSPRPRAIAPKVPRALEAICLKAMAADPNDRYAGASDLAREVEQWLADEPVEAYRESLLERGQRWARHQRGPLAVLVTVLLTGSLAGGVALALVGEARSVAARAEVEAQGARAAVRFAVDAEIKERLKQQLYVQSVALAEREWSTHHIARALELLRDCPEQLRGWEWYALERLCHAGPCVRKAHAAAVSAVAYRPDGKLLVSAGHDRLVKLWDGVTGQPLGLLGEHPAVVYDLAFHPSGRELATACWDGTVRVWDVEKRQQARTFTGPGKAIYRVAISPDGRLIACVGSEDRILLRDWATGALWHTIRHSSERLYRVAFSPDGAYLAYTTNEGVHLWDLATRRQHLLLSTGGEYVKVIAFSPDRELLATGEGDLAQGDPGFVRLWEFSTGRPLCTLVGHTEPVFGLAFSPDGARLFSASQDKTVKVWDVPARREMLTLRGHTDTVRGVACSPSGQLATAGADGTVQLWEGQPIVSPPPPPLLRHTLVGHKEEVVAVSWPQGGREVYSMSPRGEVRRWDTQTGNGEVIPPPFQGRGFGLAASPDGKWLATAMNDARVRLLDRAGRQLRVLGTQDPGPIKCVVFSPDSRLIATAGWDRTVGLWPTDGSPGKKLPPRQQPGHTDSVLGVAFHPSGKLLASAGYDNLVCVWEVLDGPDGRLLHTLRRHRSRVHSVAFSPDGALLASAGNDNVVRLWRGPGWEPAGDLEGHVGTITAVAFSPRGDLLASASHDCTVKVWDVAKGTEALTLRGHTGHVNALAFSPDGTALASTGDDMTVRIWSLPEAASPP